jgi:hypothetical protein
MRLIRAAVIALTLACLLAETAAAGVWMRSRNDVCVEIWTLRDLMRGPTAIANAVLRPVTSFVGGVWFAAAECSHSVRCVVVGPLWVVGATTYGVAQGFYWGVTGLLDTPTLGSARITPFEASSLQILPVVPFLGSHPPSNDERCEP